LNLSKITVAPPFANSAGSFAPGGAMGNSIVANLFLTSGAAAGSVALNYLGGGGTGMGDSAGGVGSAATLSRASRSRSSVRRSPISD
jgi:hypothetical protein